MHSTINKISDMKKISLQLQVNFRSVICDLVWQNWLFKDFRNNSFKYSVCWNSPVVVATFHTFCTYSLPSKPSTVQAVSSKIPAILDSFYSVMTVSDELLHGWVAGAEAGKLLALKNERGKCMDAFGQVISHSDLKPG